MRNNRLIRIYIQIKPQLVKIAQRLGGSTYADDVGVEILLQEALLNLKKCKTTRIRPHNNSYLIQRARYGMINYIKHQETLARQAIAVNSNPAFCE